jgi:hypothetical protein
VGQDPTLQAATLLVRRTLVGHAVHASQSLVLSRSAEFRKQDIVVERHAQRALLAWGKVLVEVGNNILLRLRNLLLFQRFAGLLLGLIEVG